MKFRLVKIVILTIGFLLFAIPLIVQGNLYYVGGDDMRLYYIFPEKYLQNFAFNIISDNTLGGANTGYYPTSQIVPMLYVILLLKKILPFLNTQYLMYGLNYAFGFLFFYLFISIWLKSTNCLRFFAKIVASLFYVLSPILTGTQYSNQLMSVYLVSVMPATLFYFTYAVMSKKYVYSIIAVLIFSIFSTTLNTYPWSIPILITGIPFLLFVFWHHKKRFLLNIILIIMVFLTLNMHWLFHFVNSNIFNTGVAGSLSYFSTDEFKKENIRGIMGVSTLLSPLEPILVMVNYSFKQNFRLIDFRNIIFIAIISFSGILAKKVKDKRILNMYFLSLISLLLSWFLFSPNLGNWGPGIFLKFATTLPFATMFRNMFDKFSLPFAFYYSFSLAFSLIILGEAIKNKIFGRIILLLVFLVILSDLGGFLKPRTQNQGNTGTFTGVFNDDFNNLVEYFLDLENESRVLWIPMTAPNYISVEDKYLSGHYYSGLSPLRILAGRGDYVGRFSFMLPSDVFYGDKLLKMLMEGKYEEFASNMQRMNARYVVLDNQILPDSMKPYLYDSDLKYISLQNDKLKKELLGRKIKDFGNRYSLYEINEKYMSDRIYLTDSFDEFPRYYSGLQYKKINSYLYQIKITDLKNTKKLVFLDPYYKDWVLYLNEMENKIPFEKGNNSIVKGWANGWEIDPSKIKNNFGGLIYKPNPDGGIDLTLDLYFEPQKYNSKLYLFTIFAYSVNGLYVILFLVSDIKKKHVEHE